MTLTFTSFDSSIWDDDDACLASLGLHNLIHITQALIKPELYENYSNMTLSFEGFDITPKLDNLGLFKMVFFLVSSNSKKVSSLTTTVFENYLKKSHFTRLRAKRARIIYKLNVFEFSRQNSHQKSPL